MQLERLVDAGTPNAFINDPQPTKAMYDAVQDMHPKTLSASFVLETSTRLKNSFVIFRRRLPRLIGGGRGEWSSQSSAAPEDIGDARRIFMNEVKT